VSSKTDREAKSGKDARIEKLDAQLDEALVRFGSQIRSMRKARKITQSDIEEKTGLTSGAISKIETGGREASLRSVLKIAITLGIQPSKLVSMLDDGKSDSEPEPAVGTVVGIPIVIGPGVSTDTVDKLIRELGSRAANHGQVSSGRRGR
jgi:transcriptional regulator with XRE-family HTH domain